MSRDAHWGDKTIMKYPKSQDNGYLLEKEGSSDWDKAHEGSSDVGSKVLFLDLARDYKGVCLH